MNSFDNGVNQGVFITINDTLTNGNNIVKDYFYNVNYEILGISSELSEDQCSKIVHGGMNGGYENYGTFIDMSGFECFDTAKESLNDLLKTLGIEHKCLVLIKKKK